MYFLLFLQFDFVYINLHYNLMKKLEMNFHHLVFYHIFPQVKRGFFAYRSAGHDLSIIP